jgi:hypothetical protein
VLADCIMLIAHDYLIRFYESTGFKNCGSSHCQFAGGGWFDLVIPQPYFNFILLTYGLGL